MEINYPQTRQMSDGEQFVEIFNQIVRDKVKAIDYNALGVQTIYFKDGSKCGGMWLWKQAGFNLKR